jgi:hypothetical protein
VRGLVKEDLLDIRAGIKARRYVNEATVSQGIVQRLLNILGWPVYNTEIVAPEYSLGTRRADYALCHPPREPVILIEVKQVGQSKGADRQLFEYAFHKGVPMAILTDGQEWNFFLPTEQGNYSERQLYKLDILERDPQQAESSFKRYLEYDAVRSGQAIEAARGDYRNAARRRQAQRTLPDAWAKLIESEDELLMELLSDKVEDLCGVRPDPDAVVAFLRKKPTSINEAASATSPKITSENVEGYSWVEGGKLRPGMLVFNIRGNAKGGSVPEGEAVVEEITKIDPPGNEPEGRTPHCKLHLRLVSGATNKQPGYERTKYLSIYKKALAKAKTGGQFNGG